MKRRSRALLALIAAPLAALTACGPDLVLEEAGAGGASASSATTATATTTSGSAGGGATTTTTTATTSGSGGNGGSGGGLLCVPNTDSACYDGPAGTEGVGICLAGTMTCSGDGLSFGPCTGQQLPATEDCLTTADDDCDGIAQKCPGTPIFSATAGGGGEDVGLGIATDATGNFVVVGAFDATLTFGGMSVTTAGLKDAFVAKFDSSGTPLWVKRFGDAQDQIASDVAIDSVGNILVTGQFAGDVNFGGGSFLSGGGKDIFLVKLDPNGAHLWSRQYGSGQDQIAEAVAIDTADNVLLAGYFDGTLNFGGAPMVSLGAVDIFVAKIDSSGTFAWSNSYGDSAGQAAYDVTTDQNDRVLVTGSVAGVVNFGTGALAGPGGADVFILALSSGGVAQWAKRVGDASGQEGTSIATDSANAVVVTGAFSGSANFGGSALSSPSGTDAFIAKLDAAGNHLWSKRYGQIGVDDRAEAIAVDPSDAILVGGNFAGNIDFGGGQMMSAGAGDVFVAKLDAAGTQLWAKRYGDPAIQNARAITSDASANVFVTGGFNGQIDLGMGAVASAGGGDVFILELAP